MDNLVKALNCLMNDCYDIGECGVCPYYQPDYNIDACLIDKAIDKIEALQKSNRNWRRKVQRLRKENKELKEANKV